jgi:hypothetical protein
MYILGPHSSRQSILTPPIRCLTLSSATEDADPKLEKFEAPNYVTGMAGALASLVSPRLPPHRDTWLIYPRSLIPPPLSLHLHPPSSSYFHCRSPPCPLQQSEPFHLPSLLLQSGRKTTTSPLPDQGWAVDGTNVQSILGRGLGRGKVWIQCTCSHHEEYGYLYIYSVWVMSASRYATDLNGISSRRRERVFRHNVKVTRPMMGSARPYKGK